MCFQVNKHVSKLIMFPIYVSKLTITRESIDLTKTMINLDFTVLLPVLHYLKQMGRANGFNIISRLGLVLTSSDKLIESCTLSLEG